MMVLGSCILFVSEGEHSPVPIHRMDLTCPPDRRLLALAPGTPSQSGDQHPGGFGENEGRPTHGKCVRITAIGPHEHIARRWDTTTWNTSIC
jgi:hypothetical protein